MDEAQHALPRPGRLDPVLEGLEGAVGGRRESGWPGAGRAPAPVTIGLSGSISIGMNQAVRPGPVAIASQTFSGGASSGISRRISNGFPMFSVLQIGTRTVRPYRSLA